MRTDSEILARIEELKDDDFFGFQTGDLIEHLSFDKVKPFLREDVTVTADTWIPAPRNVDAVKARMLDYMSFAWGKANDCRGLSADRSIQHMKAWLWLLNDPLGDRLSDMYNYYGKTCLRAICIAYGWDWTQWDDGIWRISEDDDGISPPEISA